MGPWQLDLCLARAFLLSSWVQPTTLVGRSPGEVFAWLFWFHCTLTGFFHLEVIRLGRAVPSSVSLRRQMVALKIFLRGASGVSVFCCWSILLGVWGGVVR
jgi:hypothetical protein